MPTSIDNTTDFELILVEETFEAPSCEHSQHSNPAFAMHHADEECWYVQIFSPCCGGMNQVIVLCGRFVRTTVLNPAATVLCGNCGTRLETTLAYRVIGKVSDTSR